MFSFLLQNFKQWPNRLYGFSLFPNDFLEPVYFKMGQLPIVHHNCTCISALHSTFDLCTHYYYYTMCPNMAPIGLMKVPFKIILDGQNPHLLRFIRDIRNHNALTLAEHVELSLEAHPDVSRCLVISLIRYDYLNFDRESGRPLVTLNCKMQFLVDNQSLEVDYFTFDISDHREIADQLVNYRDEISRKIRYLVHDAKMRNLKAVSYTIPERCGSCPPLKS